MRLPTRNARHGVTLVELLVIMAILASLIATVAPAIQAAREHARRGACLANLRQLGLAIHNYHDARRALPVGSIKGQGSANTGWGWGAAILPHVEASDIFAAIHFDQPTATGGNATGTVHRHLPTFACPSDSGPHAIMVDGVRLAAGNYCGSAGSRGALTPGVFHELSDVRFARITDGLGKTLMVGERVNQLETSVGSVTSGWFGHLVTQDGFHHSSVPHLDVVDFVPINLDRSYPGCFSSYHSGGVNFLMCDGGSMFVPNELDGRVFQALGTRAAGD